jgi:hypothetical protein
MKRRKPYIVSLLSSRTEVDNYSYSDAWWDYLEVSAQWRALQEKYVLTEL